MEFKSQKDFERFMGKKVHSICMSIRHDYGLMGPIASEKLKNKTIEYIYAISKELPND